MIRQYSSSLIALKAFMDSIKAYPTCYFAPLFLESAPPASFSSQTINNPQGGRMIKNAKWEPPFQDFKSFEQSQEEADGTKFSRGDKKEKHSTSHLAIMSSVCFL